VEGPGRRRPPLGICEPRDIGAAVLFLFRPLLRAPSPTRCWLSTAGFLLREGAPMNNELDPLHAKLALNGGQGNATARIVGIPRTGQGYTNLLTEGFLSWMLLKGLRFP